jgi:hypothetical protein
MKFMLFIKIINLHIMKKFIILFLVVTTFFSCSSDDVRPFTDYQGKWELTQMTGRTANSEITGSAMEWQEFYLLDANGTFIKSRKQNGIVTEISGTFSLIKSSNSNALQLTYKSESEIIGSCFSGLKEEMHFQSEKVFVSTWQQCDGPGLKYERKY